MKKALIVSATAVALAVGSTTSAGAAGRGSPSATLSFLDAQTQFVSNIPEAQAPKLGDQFWTHEEFFRWNGAKRGSHLGHADGHAVVMPGGMVEYTGIAVLPGGTVAVLGEIGQQGTFTLVVVGGTGAYAAARGDVTVRSIGGADSNKSADTLRLWS